MMLTPTTSPSGCPRLLQHPRVAVPSPPSLPGSTQCQAPPVCPAALPASLAQAWLDALG